MSHFEFEAFFCFRVSEMVGWCFFGLEVTLKSDEDDANQGEKAKLVLIEVSVHGLEEVEKREY
jgi:hypothetical protein